MRVLHTSDWHLGRSFHRVGMLDAQATYIDHLVEVVSAEQVDVVVVSGDVFDRALAPVDAVALGSSALRRLVSAGARVVMTSGNHDSAPRLGFASELLDLAGVHLRTDHETVGRPVLIPDRHGDVAFYGIPYLEPDLVAPAWSLDRRGHQAVLGAAMGRVVTDLDKRPPGTRSVVLAHAFAIGGQPSDSERDISVGGVQSVAVETFEGVDYAALGHLHGRHTLTPAVRYSGSPLAYSFSERNHVKGAWLVDLGPSGVDDVQFVEAPVPRPLAALRGDLEDLLLDPSLQVHEQSWVHATLTDVQRPKRAMERLQRRFPFALVLAYDAPTVDPLRVAAAAPQPRRSDADTVADFYTDVAGRAIGKDEAALVEAACDACRIAEDAAS